MIRPTPASRRRTHAALRGLPKALGLTFGAAFCYAASLYPFGATWLAGVVVLYIALLCWRGQLWLFALPALVPALDLAPWTGWFFVEEIDLLLLLTAAFGYWRLPGATVHAHLPRFASYCVAAITLAYLIGTFRGLLPLPALDANAFNNYLSRYNSLRMAKAWCWTLILLPMLTRAAGPQLVNLRRHFLPGMLSGLLLVSGAALWERMVFPGLLDFSSEYRTSAPFSSMHTGGAALDGYLALSLPFVACWLLAPPSRRAWASALALLALGAYAGLSTFSRGLYGAFVCSAAVLGLFLLIRAPRRRYRWRPILAGAALAALNAFALLRMFAGAGYRGLAAAIVLLGATVMLLTLPLPRRLLPAALLCAGAAQLVLALLGADAAPRAGLFSPPYLLFLLATGVFLGAYWRVRQGGPSPQPGPLGIALIAYLSLVLNTLWIAEHRGGDPALAAAAPVAALALLVAASHIVLRRPPWRSPGYPAMAAAAVLLSISIPIGASYYAAERFADSGADLRLRLRHWTHVVSMMDEDWPTRTFGMGLGTFPATYFWRNPRHEVPAAYRYIDEDNNRHLRLGAPQYARGYGEILRLLQRLPVRPHTTYLLALDVRRRSDTPLLIVSLCERFLLYEQNCVVAPLRLLPADGRWHHYRVTLDSAALGSGSWALRPPVQLELGADGAPGTLDVDNVSVRRVADQEELVRNGAFSDANNYWFFSSDRYHLPWHIENLPLNLYFELGWLGLLSFSCLLAHTTARLLRQLGGGDVWAAASLAALLGFLCVGLFDSLFDVPRLSLLFFLVLHCAALRTSASIPPHTGAAP